MTLTDDTVTKKLPVLRPAAPLDEVLTGPSWWLRLVAWVDAWFVLPAWDLLDWWRDRYPAKHRLGVAPGTYAQRWAWAGPTGEWPALGGVT
jgi:hypothetical protein